jgi:small subunit ribosomal protein S13
MVRIAGIDLPRLKRIEYSLTKIYGIGVANSRKILTKAKEELLNKIKTHAVERNIQLEKSSIRRNSSFKSSKRKDDLR